MRDEEQHVVTTQKHRLDDEEITGDDARCLRPQELAPTRPCAPRRRLQPPSGEKAADARRRDAEAELGQLAADPPMAPARILAREPQHQLANLSRERRPSSPSGGLPPLPAHERAMPTKQRPRRHQQDAQRRPRQVTSDGRQQGSISCATLLPRNLAAENLELVTQHKQLDVFHLQAAAAPNERTKQSPNSEVDEGEDHAPDPPSPRAKERRHQYWHPSRRGTSAARPVRAVR